MKKTAINHLEELLQTKDDRIEELETELSDANDKLERNHDWSHHRDPENPDPRLPVPRLEIRAINESGDWACFTWQYALIYKHLLDHLIAVPIGETGSSGSRGNAPVWPDGRIILPFRDGAHIAHDTMHLGIPAFAICEERIERITMKDGVIQQEEFKQ